MYIRIHNVLYVSIYIYIYIYMYIFPNVLDNRNWINNFYCNKNTFNFIIIHNINEIKYNTLVLLQVILHRQIITYCLHKFYI